LTGEPRAGAATRRTGGELSQREVKRGGDFSFRWTVVAEPAKISKGAENQGKASQ